MSLLERLETKAKQLDRAVRDSIPLYASEKADLRELLEEATQTIRVLQEDVERLCVFDPMFEGKSRK